MVDRGECSAAVSWRELAQGLSDGVDEVLAAVGGRPDGNWVMTFDLRQPGFGSGDRDRFTFTRPYELSLLSINLAFVLTGRFQVIDQALVFQLIDVFFQYPDGGVMKLSPEEQVTLQVAIDQGLLDILAQSLRDTPVPEPSLGCRPGGHAQCFRQIADILDFEFGAGATSPRNLRCVELGQDNRECRFVPNVHRVNHRLDGVEAVLSETAPTGDDPDPFFEILDAEGTCRGLTIGPGAPVPCVHDAIFEIPPLNRRGIRFCGDQLMSR